MASDDDFITPLMGFGLTEKEAQCYFYLLKYGPKTPSPLAKSLHTYREDVHRTLQSLIDKGMVRPSLDAPTLYTAVELETALESALKKHEAELHEMERRKRELEELSRQQHFRSLEEVSTFKILKTIGELIAVSLPVIEQMQEEWLIATPAFLSTVASVFGVNDFASEFIRRGGKVRVIIDVSHKYIEPIREMIAIGEEVRRIEEHGILFTVYDRKVSISAISFAEKVSLDAPVRLLWTDDPSYAKYLATTFELLWKQSIPAEQRMQQLLANGLPQAD